MSLSHLYLHQKNDLHINNSHGPPSEFPLTSSCAGKVHHHSGSISNALYPCPKASYFLFAFTVNEQRLALQINSLIRVSRRALINSLTLGQVQALFTNPSWSSFHLSFTLLVIYRSPHDIQPQMGHTTYLRHHSQGIRLSPTHRGLSSVVTRLSLCIACAFNALKNDDNK